MQFCASTNLKNSTSVRNNFYFSGETRVGRKDDDVINVDVISFTHLVVKNIINSALNNAWRIFKPNGKLQNSFLPLLILKAVFDLFLFRKLI